MLATGEPKHLAEWQEYHALEPFGEPWRRHSLMTARTLNTMIGMVPRKENGPPQEYYDDDTFVPSRKNREQSSAEIQAQCDAADSIEGLGI